MEFKKDDRYYLVIHKRDWTYKPSAIIPVIVIRRHNKFSDWVDVIQEIDGYRHKITVHINWLAPHNIENAKNLLYNMNQWEERWSANGWRHGLRKTKKDTDEILAKIASLSKQKQRKIWESFRKAYPKLIRDNNKYYTSKLKMTQWDELAWAFISSKYPLKEVWPTLNEDI